MSIFRKTKHDVNAKEETSMAKNSSATQITPMEKSVFGTLGSSGTGSNYGIEEAVNLMRSLPNVESETTITVVKKTLESANVRVSDIITDAEKKEANIEQRNRKLSLEIEELQEKISLRNKEISTLTKDLKETSKVKKLLQQGENKTAGNDTKPAAGTKVTGSDAAPPGFRPSGYAKESTTSQQNPQRAKIVET